VLKKKRRRKPNRNIFEASKAKRRRRRSNKFAYDKLFLPSYSDNRKKIIPIAISLLLVSIVFLGLVYIVFFSEVLHVKTIQVKNQGKVVTLSANEIRDRFVDLYGKHIMFVDIEVLLTDIINENPRIQRIEAVKNYPGSLIFSFYEYEILGALQDSNSQEWALINQKGLVVENHLKEPPAGLVRMKYEIPTSFEDEKVVFDEDDIEYMVQMMMEFYNTTGLVIEEIIVNTVSGEYTMKNSKGWSIIVNSEYSPELVFSNLNSIISQVDLGENYKLIDLRIPNRAFICYKENGCSNNSPKEITEEE